MQMVLGLGIKVDSVRHLRDAHFPNSLFFSPFSPYNLNMERKYLGVSPFFYVGAEGHYERVHVALHKAIMSLVGTYKSHHLYFGAQNLEQRGFSQGVVDETFKRPDGKIPFSQLSSLSKSLETAAGTDALFIHIYEGSISFLLALKLLQRRGVRITAIINLHQIDLFEKLFNDFWVRGIYRFVFHRSLRFSKSVIFTAESAMSARSFGTKLDMNFEVFPVFSTIEEREMNSTKVYPNLILFSGEFDEETMMSDLEGIGVSGKDSLIFDARIFEMATPTFRNFLEEAGYLVIGQRVSGDEYEEVFKLSKKVWFSTVVGMICEASVEIKPL
jgi:hypothetical protein